MTQAHPPFYKALKNKDLYPEATRQIKFVETRTSYFFTTGASRYKIKKSDHDYSSPAVTEAFLNEELRLGKIYAGEIYQEVLPLSEQNGEYHFDAGGNVVSYAIKLGHISERYFLDSLLARKKVTPTIIGRIAKYLAQIHSENPVEGRGDAGRPENLYNLCEDILYQTQKYLNTTITQPMLDIIRRPLEKFVEEHRKLFSRRVKKKRIIQGHGALLPEHIYIKGMDVYFVSPQELHRKFCLLDAANDIAYLTVEFARVNEPEWMDLFVKRYIAAARDRDLTTMLPTYQTFVALKQGVVHSEWMTETEGEFHAEQAQIASDYFNLAVKFSRDIPKF
ncbi:MAG: hypothetical protein HQM13_20035 [SAR324 cluster bacterium]|nr:hypothetical protein [SAR324 cluster bacterium]